MRSISAFILMACILMLATAASATDIGQRRLWTPQSARDNSPQATVTARADDDAGPAPAVPAAARARTVPGEVLVLLQEGAPSPALGHGLQRASGAIARAMAEKGVAGEALRVRKSFPHLERAGRGRVMLLSSDAPMSEVLAALADDPDVAAVSPNYVRHVDAVPNDPLFTQLWGLDNTGQVVLGTTGVAGADIDAVAAWDVIHNASTVVVADIDTGVDYTHPDLIPNMWRNPGEIAGNGVDDDGNGYVDDVFGIDAVEGDADPMDDHGHGTHTSGTIGAVGGNGLGVAGVAWSVRIMALKFLNSSGDGYDSGAVECIDYLLGMAARGENVRVINASWGGYGENSVLQAAIEAAGDAGIVFVAAAGNEGLDADQTPHYPSSYDSWNILSVAATTHTDLLAAFSNRGNASVDLAAPGASILSTMPWFYSRYTPAPGDVAFTDLENGTTGWEAQPPWALSTEDAYSLSRAWSDSPGGPYAENLEASLTTPSIALAAHAGESLQFGFACVWDLEDGYDFLDIEFSSDGGQTWVYRFSISGSSASWQFVTEPIPPQFRTNRFRVRMTLRSDASNGWDGVHIDNLGVGATAAYSTMSGTSMATPHVSGACALLSALYPDDGPARSIQRVLSGVTPLPGLAGKVRTGGRLNLARTLEPALPLVPLVRQISPAEGLRPGDALSLSGLGFGDAPGRVLFGDVSAVATGWSDTGATVTVPRGAGNPVRLVTASGSTANPFIATSWARRAPLAPAVSCAGEAVLNGLIYTCGGYLNYGYTRTDLCRRYDPAADLWEPLPPLPTPRANLGAATLDGKVYFVGGYDDAVELPMNTVEAYEPVNGTWTTLAPLPVALSWPSVFAYGGSLYVVGGFNNAVDARAVYRYDPESNAWAAGLSPMPTLRTTPGTALARGRIYVFGGVTPSGSYLDTVEMYDIAADAWTTLPPMPLRIARMGAASDGDRIMAAGGTSTGFWFGPPRNVVLSYDVRSGSWSTSEADLESLPRGIIAPGLVNLRGKGFYSLGGLDGAANSAQVRFRPFRSQNTAKDLLPVYFLLLD